jgi:uncharacterized protein YodC (DUF2158 family)
MNFEVGEVVRLKSGVPIMVIESIGRTGIVCAWFGTDSVKHTDTFSPDTLLRAKVD